jgi:hypothetical protein
MAAHQQQQQAAQQAAAQQALVAQQTKTQLNQWDSQFDESVKNESPEMVKRVRSEIGRLAQTHYGISQEDLANAWQTESWIHHPAVQRMMYDAAKYHLAQEAAVTNRARPVPRVQRPGSDGDFGYVDHSGVAEAFKAFEADSTPRKAAAALIARRQANQRRANQR